MNLSLTIEVSWRVAQQATTLEHQHLFWDIVREQLYGMWLLLNYNRELLPDEQREELMGDLELLRAVANELKYGPLTPVWYRQ